MIVVRIRDGIGNQLFQYATGRALAHKLGTTLKLDITDYEKQELRNYRLDKFQISATVATEDEVARVTLRRKSGLREELIRRAQRFLPYFYRRVFYDARQGYDRNLFRVHGDVYLSGFWQDQSYFSHMRQILEKDLKFRSQPTGLNKQLINKIESTESVCLHVRRGDYALNANAKLGLCSLQYYQRAIRETLNRITQPHFFIFSDDIEWTHEHIRPRSPATYVSHNQVENDYEDLRLMIHCKHHIIANSTFSWWGAWLGMSKGQFVIAPHPWYAEEHRNHVSPVCSHWIRLPR